MTINEWMLANDLFLCTGCKGYDRTEHALWIQTERYSTRMPFCTNECAEEVDA